MKFSKKLKALAVAIPMMALSTAAAVSGTVAWFVASNVVTAQGMTVQAQAEDGIVIANETHAAASDWKQTVNASHDGQITGASSAEQAKFIPTSTATAETWYHANADEFDSYVHNSNPYLSFNDNTAHSLNVSETEAGKGVYRIDLDTNVSDDVHDYRNIYLLNKFYVQSTISTDLAGQDLRVKQVSATSSVVLNKTLRVLFKVTNTAAGGTAKTLIYAPVATADVAHNGTTNGKIGGNEGTTLTALYNANSRNITDDLLDNCTIKGYTDNGANAIEISMYVYFEGEDANCKSSNLQETLSAVSISFKLENKTHEANNA